MQKSRWIKRTAAGTVILLMLTMTYLTYGQSVIFNNPGMLVNTSGDDYSPSCTADGKTILFSSRSEEESTHKIYTCTNENDAWSEPYPVLEVSSESNDETPFISADGQMLIFSSDRPGGYSPSATADNNKRITFDIYISRKVNGQWTLPELVAGDVNTNMNERSPSISPDGRTLFFTRFPYRNIAKSVIYMASWDGNRFIDVKPLPESINSGNYELSFIPSYSRSGVYYFASRRSGGYGGWDIWSTTLSEKGFSDPVNAGSSINSRFDDLYLTETASLMMFCSNRTGGFGGYDIYVSSTVKHADDTKTGKSNAPSGIRLTVKDKAYGKTIAGAEVSVYRQSVSGEGEQAGKWEVFTCNPRGELVINTAAGERWLMVKPSGKTYGGKTVRVRLIPGQIQNIELIVEKAAGGDADKHIEPEKQVHLTARDGSGLPELKPVYFSFDSTEIRTEYIPVLHGIIEYLRNNPDTDVIIRGHGDRRGSKKANYIIGRLRAEKVMQYIKSMGIDASRIRIVSLGETDPQIHGGKNDDALNRRVEFEFVNRKTGSREK